MVAKKTANESGINLNGYCNLISPTGAHWNSTHAMNALLHRIAVANILISIFQTSHKKTDHLIWMTIKVYFSIVILPGINAIVQSDLMIGWPDFVMKNFNIIWHCTLYFYFLLQMNSVANCFLYAGRITNFRKFVKRLLCRCTMHGRKYDLRASVATTVSTAPN